jgi:hypothetical protein
MSLVHSSIFLMRVSSSVRVEPSIVTVAAAGWAVGGVGGSVSV